MALLSFSMPGEWLVPRIPVLNTMLGVYFISFSLFAWSLLGTMGLAHWFSEKRKPLELIWVVGFVVLMAGWAGVLLWFNAGYLRMAGHLGYVQRQIGIGLGVALAGLALLGLSCVVRRREVLWACAMIVLAVDLCAASRGLNTTMPKRLVFPDTALTDYLRGEKVSGRVCVESGGVPGGFLQSYGIEELFGYDGIYTARVLEFHHQLGKALWDAMAPACAIAYCLHDPAYKEPIFTTDLEGRYALVAERDGIQIYESKEAYPRAYLVPDLEVAPDREALFAALRDPAFNPKMHAITDAPPAGRLPGGAEQDPGAAAVVRREATEVVIDVEASAECVLVLTDAFFPGWRALVDGRDAEIFPVYHAFRGLIVRAGKHRVEFYYSPLSFRMGLAISIMTLVAGLAAAVWALSRMRRGGATHE